MTHIKRYAGAASAAVLLTLSLSACGDDEGGSSEEDVSVGDSPDDASAEDFCEAYNATSDLEADASAAEKADEAHEQANELLEVGTPEDIDDDSREGFEILVGAVAEISEEGVEEFENAETEEAFKEAIGASDADYEKVTAFLTYAQTTCSETETPE